MNRKTKVSWEDRQRAQGAGKRGAKDSDLAQLLDAAHSTPVELDTGADAVDARAKHQDVGRSEVEVMGGAPVRQVQVIGLRRPFGRNRVDLFHRWADAQFLA